MSHADDDLASSARSDHLTSVRSQPPEEMAITLPPAVPSFLQGCWARRQIRRADDEGRLGPADTSPVRYVQTPHAFVDVRRDMAFAGITTTASVLPPGAGSWADGCGGARRIFWHSCHNHGLDPMEMNYSEECWRMALAGLPRDTEDVGDFLPLEGWTGNLWRETDPDGTLEEEWQRVDDGGGLFLAARRPGALLVVVGGWFGYAEDYAGGEEQAVTTNRGWSAAQQLYASGDITPDGWTVDLCADPALEGSEFPGVAGESHDWTVLPGSTASWPPQELASPLRFRGAGCGWQSASAFEHSHSHAQSDDQQYGDGDRNGDAPWCTHDSGDGEHEHGHGCCTTRDDSGGRARRALHEGAAAAHMSHAIEVRNDWLKRAMEEAEAADREEGVWDTLALRASLFTTQAAFDAFSLARRHLVTEEAWSEAQTLLSMTDAAAKAGQVSEAEAEQCLAGVLVSLFLPRGARVVIGGLTAKPALNGLRATVLGGVKDGRVPVAVEGEHAPVRLRPRNMRPPSASSVSPRAAVAAAATEPTRHEANAASAPPASSLAPGSLVEIRGLSTAAYNGCVGEVLPLPNNLPRDEHGAPVRLPVKLFVDGATKSIKVRPGNLVLRS